METLNSYSCILLAGPYERCEVAWHEGASTYHTSNLAGFPLTGTCNTVVNVTVCCLATVCWMLHTLMLLLIVHT